LPCAKTRAIIIPIDREVFMPDSLISCSVVKVDEARTKCQKVGSTYNVDDTLAAHICQRACALVQSAASEMSVPGVMSSSAPDHPYVDVPCPDGYVVYRLSKPAKKKK
jgi:hypothetical protein